MGEWSIITIDNHPIPPFLTKHQWVSSSKLWAYGVTFRTIEMTPHRSPPAGTWVRARLSSTALQRMCSWRRKRTWEQRRSCRRFWQLGAERVVGCLNFDSTKINKHPTKKKLKPTCPSQNPALKIQGASSHYPRWYQFEMVARHPELAFHWSAPKKIVLIGEKNGSSTVQNPQKPDTFPWLIVYMAYGIISCFLISYFRELFSCWCLNYSYLTLWTLGTFPPRKKNRFRPACNRYV